MQILCINNKRKIKNLWHILAINVNDRIAHGVGNKIGSHQLAHS